MKRIFKSLPVALAALLLAGLAGAEPTVTVTYPTEATPLTVNADDFAVNIDVAIKFSTDATEGTAYLMADKTTLPSPLDHPDNDARFITSVDIQPGNTASTEFELTPGAANIYSHAATKAEGNKSLYVVVNDTSGDTDSDSYAGFTILFDLTAPPAPSGVSAGPGDTQLHVAWTAPTDVQDYDGTLRYHVYWDGPDNSGDSGLLTGTGYVIENLTNGTTYNITVKTIDEAGNESDPSAAVQGAPQPTVDFWERYQNAGGDESGSCAVFPRNARPGLTGILLLLAASLFFAFGRKAGAVAFLLALLFATGTARAETPRSSLLDVQFGHLVPRLDSDPALGGATPFKDTFGDASPLWLQLHYSYEIFQQFGTLSLGGGPGYYKFKGTAYFEDGTASADKTSLIVFPFMFSAIYRYDTLEKKSGFPLVPYGSVGLDWHLWRITDAAGNTAQLDPAMVEFGRSGKASGSKWGYHYALGLQILLDFFEPHSAAAMDYSYGINSTYLFMEYAHLKVDNFGGRTFRMFGKTRGGNGFDLGGDTLRFGLTFEF